MAENSNITSNLNTNKENKDGATLLKLKLDKSDLPEISIDVSKLDITSENTKTAEEIGAFNNTKNDELSTDNDNTLTNSAAKSSTASKNSLNSKSKFNFVWVSNIRRGIKATEIKKFFSQIGKVTSVKILTNGKNFYGYVSMETQEMAAKCISDLNESLFQGEKIIVSRKRPDLIDFSAEKVKKKTSLKNKEHKNQKEILNTDLKTENSVLPENNKSKKSLKHIDHQRKETDEKEKTDQFKQLMNSKVDSLTQNNKILKQRLNNLQQLYDEMSKKYHSLKNVFNKIKFESHLDKKKFIQEKESFQKYKKMELSKIETDKTNASKELAEIKILKENLKQKLNNIKFESKKSFKRERSPLTRINRSPRRRVTPPSRHPDFYRNDQRGDKKYRRGPSRERTPPPPNLISDMEKKRSGVNNSSNRPTYYSQNPKPQVSGSQEYRQNRSFPDQQFSRGDWMGYQKNMRRTNSNQNYECNPDGRFNGPVVQHPPSAIVVPPRVQHGSYYYPQW